MASSSEDPPSSPRLPRSPRMYNLRNYDISDDFRVHMEMAETCCHNVLWDGEAALDAPVATRAMFSLSWSCKGIENTNKDHYICFNRGNIKTADRTKKQISLTWESKPNTVLILIEDLDTDLVLLCADMVRWLRDEHNLNVYVEPPVRELLLENSSYFDFLQTWTFNREIEPLHTKVDIMITVGGDDIVLTAASLFNRTVPPIVPFSLGPAGFLSPFSSEHYRESLVDILKGPIAITLRNRLQCRVLRNNASIKGVFQNPILVLNQIVIDRGSSSRQNFELECYCDGTFVTSVAGDGMVISTATGSTGYTMACGGSLVHPQVGGILFSPKNANSPTFRPLVMSEDVTIKVQVPETAISPACIMATFDGMERKQLDAGDAIECTLAPWPVPTVCLVDTTIDFLNSVKQGDPQLRNIQSHDGLHDT